jgi:hypothetical protein
MAIHEQELIAKIAYPGDATFITGGGTGTAGNQNQQTLAAAVNKTTYLSKAIITSQGPATQVGGVVTISDGTWTLSFQFVETITAGGFMHLDFGDAPLVGSAVNTAITVTIPAIGSGAATAVALVGYQR